MAEKRRRTHGDCGDPNEHLFDTASELNLHQVYAHNSKIAYSLRSGDNCDKLFLCVDFILRTCAREAGFAVHPFHTKLEDIAVLLANYLTIDREDCVTAYLTNVFQALPAIIKLVTNPEHSAMLETIRGHLRTSPQFT